VTFRPVPPLALAAALLVPACVVDPQRSVLPGSASVVVLGPRAPRVRATWPVPYRRAAEFRIENRTGAPVETVLFDMTGAGRVSEILEARVTSPASRSAEILSAPHGSFPRRVRLGVPGTVLLADGESLVLEIHLWGEPAGAVAEITVPGVTGD
jgi:hypothetical protein